MLLALIAIVLFAVASLVAGAAYLGWALPGGVPLGNLITVAGMLAGAAIPLRVMPGGRGFRWLARIVFACALAWYPIGILACGNPRLEFTGAAAYSMAYWRFTAALGLAIVAMIGLTVFLSLRSAIELAEFDE